MRWWEWRSLGEWVLRTSGYCSPPYAGLLHKHFLPAWRVPGFFFRLHLSQFCHCALWPKKNMCGIWRVTMKLVDCSTWDSDLLFLFHWLIGTGYLPRRSRICLDFAKIGIHEIWSLNCFPYMIFGNRVGGHKYFAKCFTKFCINCNFFTCYFVKFRETLLEYYLKKGFAHKIGQHCKSFAWQCFNALSYNIAKLKHFSIFMHHISFTSK